MYGCKCFVILWFIFVALLSPHECMIAFYTTARNRRYRRIKQPSLTTQPVHFNILCARKCDIHSFESIDFTVCLLTNDCHTCARQSPSVNRSRRLMPSYGHVFRHDSHFMDIQVPRN